MSTSSKARWMWLALVAIGSCLLFPGCCGDFGGGCSLPQGTTTPSEICDAMNPCPPIAGDVNAPATVTVAIRGTNLTDPIAINTDGDGVTVIGWSFVNGEIQTTLAVANNAALGAHSLSPVFGHNGEVTDIGSTDVYVTCPSCVPTPRLRSMALTDGGSLIRLGETKVVRFVGREFLNNSPVVQFDPEATGLSLPPNTTITVQRQGTVDYFDVPIVVAPDARSGSHRVRVVTAGGRTAWKNLVVGSDPSLGAPPGSVPSINSISPGHITKGIGTWIKLQGSGFGGNPTFTGTTCNGFGQRPPTTTQDRTLVARFSCNTVGPMQITVTNRPAGYMSSPYTIFVDNIDPTAPLLDGASAGFANVVSQGGSADWSIDGTNLAGATDAGWSGTRGLTFSNTQVFSDHVTVHVTAALNAALTGDEATNIALTTPAGQSPPTEALVLPH